MRKGSIATLGKATLIGYLYRVFFNRVVKKKESVWIRYLVNLVCYRVRYPNSAGIIELKRKYALLPKFLRYDFTSFFDNSTKLEHYYNDGNLISINGYPAYVYVPVAASGIVIEESILVPKIFFDKIRDTLDEMLAPKKEMIDRVYLWSWDTYWNDVDARVTPSLDRIPIHSEIKEKLRGHIAKLLHEWVDKQNLDYSRNLLFYGPKGTGKSSMIGAIASELNSYLYNFPSTKKESDFRKAIGQISANSVVVCDEADLIPQFNKNSNTFEFGTFSKRNVLDYFSGINMPKGCVTIVGTNNPEELDDRLDRKGRFKEKLYIGDVDHLGIVEWLKNNHDYIVPEGVTLRPMTCADIFDQMDTLDDPAAFVEANKLT